MNTPGVYRIQNVLTGGVYIGSTARSIRKRLWEHRRKLELGGHVNPKLQAAWNKYGADAFVFEPLVALAPEETREFEQRALDHFASSGRSYNLARDARGAMKGRRHSAKTKEQLSRAQWQAALGRTPAVHQQGRSRLETFRRDERTDSTGASWKEALA